MNDPRPVPHHTGRELAGRVHFPDLSRRVVGAAMTVSNAIGPGLREKVYERALCIELARQQIPFTNQRSFEVRYEGQLIDTYVPDLIIDDSFLVDTKVVAAFDESHEAQMLTYLAITGYRLAILLNFKHRKMTWKRIVR